MSKQIEDTLRKHRAECEIHLKCAYSIGFTDNTDTVINENIFTAGAINTETTESPRDADLTIRCIEKLGVISKFFNEDDRAKKIFQYLLSSYKYPDNLGKLLEKKPENNLGILSRNAEGLIRIGIYCQLAEETPAHCNHFFELAMELLESPATVQYSKKGKMYMDLAMYYLWRGYTLMALRQYENALQNFSESEQYFALHKKSGRDQWGQTEYYLLKVVISLSRCLTGSENEDCVAARENLSLYEKQLKMDNLLERYLLHYYHLKKDYARILSPVESAVSGRQKVNQNQHKVAVKKSEAAEYDFKGKVIVADSDRCVEEEFGFNKELEDYVEKVDRLGNFPVLSNLMELFISEGEQDPEPLIEECERLLKIPGLDPFLAVKTNKILEAARFAKEIHLNFIVNIEMED